MRPLDETSWFLAWVTGLLVLENRVKFLKRVENAEFHLIILKRDSQSTKQRMILMIKRTKNKYC